MNTIYKGEDKKIIFRIKDQSVPQRETWTLADMTAGTMILQIEGESYYQIFDTDVSTTVTAFVNKYADELLQKGILLSESSGVMTFIGLNPLKSFTVKSISAGTGGTLTQSVLEGFLDIDNANGITVQLIDCRDVVVKKYSKQSISGYADITVEDADAGKISILLESSDTTSLTDGYLKAEIKIELENTEFDSSTFFDVSIIDKIAEVKDSKSKTITDLSP